MHFDGQVQLQFGVDHMHEILEKDARQTSSFNKTMPNFLGQFVKKFLKLALV